MEPIPYAFPERSVDTFVPSITAWDQVTPSQIYRMLMSRKWEYPQTCSSLEVPERG